MRSSTIVQSAYCQSSTSPLQERSLMGLKNSWMKDSHTKLTAVLTQTTSLSSSQCTVYNGTMNRDEFNGAESRRVFAETQELEFSIAWRYSRERRRNFYVSSELLKKLLKAVIRDCLFITPHSFCDFDYRVKLQFVLTYAGTEVIRTPNKIATK
ncbi:hypothetical protein RB195_024338 [Necator americanus]|uniref:Uncharacterized protein n=1 Tax=Necator americanus TaxID=51031 RepID=A0ABR1ENK2_NECAM